MSANSTVARPGSSTLLIIGVVLAISLCALLTGYLLLGGDSGPQDGLLIHTVTRGKFEHDVVERGEIESSSNIEVRCEVKTNNTSGITILWVIDEGMRVKTGDVLVRLDDSALQQERIQQQITRNTSQALMVQAKNEFEAAKIAKIEYDEGTFRQEEQTIQSELFVAEENLRRAQQYALYSERLAAKGYVTALQLEGDRFAVEKARNEVDTARTKLRVLQEYTREKMLMELESAIRTAEAKWKAEQDSFQLEQSKLNDIESQIALCEIRAPQAGQVVYANRESRRGDGEFVVEAGTLVREQQPIVRLPDPQNMQVKANINESRVTMIKPGMQVRIRLDAFPDATLHGEVVKVKEYPEPSSWFSSEIKEYATYVKIFDPPSDIRPGLTAEVRIEVARIADAMQVPVQAIHEHGKQLFCMVKRGDGWDAREVQIDASNDKFVTIHSGLSESEQVALNPRGLLDQVNLPEIIEEPDDRPARDVREPDTVATAEQSGSHDDQEDGGSQLRITAPRPLTNQLDSERVAVEQAPRTAIADVAALSTTALSIMGNFDRNGDGMLSGDELLAEDATRFSSADTDGDGSINRSELAAALTQAAHDDETDPNSGPSGAGL